MANIADQKILFLQGTQQQLDNINLENVQVGAFYLTNDTHRLYIAEEVGKKPVPVNQGVVEVAAIANLPGTGTPGQFYYAAAENVLCVYSKSQWIQINTDTTLQADSLSCSVSKTSDNNITIETLVKDSANNQSTSEFELEAGAGVNFSVDGNKIIIASSGAGSAVVDLSLVGSEDNKTAQIAAKTTVKSAAGDTTEQSDLVTLKAGDNIESLIVEGDAVTINASTQEVKTLEFDNLEEGFDLTLTQTSGNQITASTTEKLDPVIKIGNPEVDPPIHFVNGIATLDVYTTTQTDTKIENEITSRLRIADAMTFKGVINTAEDLPAITNAANGDTYKVGTAGTYVGKAAKVGDLFIANGVEDAETGNITTGSWEYVPAANEYETKVSAITHGIQITDDAEDTTILGSIALAEGKQIALADSGEGSEKVVTVSHADITTTTNTDAPADTTAYVAQTGKQHGRTKDITVIKAVTIDNGHVTNVETAKETIEDTTFETLETTYSVNNGEVSIETVLTDTKDNHLTQNLNVKSETLTLTIDDENAVKAELLWGSF